MYHTPLPHHIHHVTQPPITSYLDTSPPLPLSQTWKYGPRSQTLHFFYSRLSFIVQPSQLRPQRTIPPTIPSTHLCTTSLNDNAGNPHGHPPPLGLLPRPHNHLLHPLLLLRPNSLLLRPPPRLLRLPPSLRYIRRLRLPRPAPIRQASN